MKIFENNYDVEVGRIIYTNNFFRLIKEIVKENKDTLVITPFTKIKEVINFNKTGGLDHYFMQQDLGVENSLNIASLNSVGDKLNDLLKSEFLSLNLDFQKFMKNIWELSDDFISDDNINAILRFLQTNIMKLPLIIIAGFDNVELDKSIPHLELINNFIGKVKYSNINNLLIDHGDDIFEVYDVDAFVSWLELKTKTVIDQNMINNFLNNKADISSYLISNALKELK